jgi:hypothetical protein
VRWVCRIELLLLLEGELGLIGSIPHLLLRRKRSRNTATLTHRALLKPSGLSISLHLDSISLARPDIPTLPSICPRMKGPSSRPRLCCSSPSTASKCTVAPYGSLTAVCPCALCSGLCRRRRRWIINPVLRSHLFASTMDRQKNFPHHRR